MPLITPLLKAQLHLHTAMVEADKDETNQDRLNFELAQANEHISAILSHSPLTSLTFARQLTDCQSTLRNATNPAEALSILWTFANHLEAELTGQRPNDDPTP